MKNNFSEFKHFKLHTQEGSCGHVSDLLVEDDTWMIRYLVVEISLSVTQRQILLSPSAIRSIDMENRVFSTELDLKQVLASPPVSEVEPISRKYEKALVEYYGWPIYWLGRAIQLSPQKLQSIASEEIELESEHCNLRSAKELCGYGIESTEGPVGTMKDLVIDMAPWKVDYAIAASNSWLSSTEAEFSTKWISQVDWHEKVVKVDLRKSVFEPVKQKSIQSVVGWETTIVEPNKAHH